MVIYQFFFSSQIDLHRDAVDHVALRLDRRLLHRRPSRGWVWLGGIGAECGGNIIFGAAEAKKMLFLGGWDVTHQ